MLSVVQMIVMGHPIICINGPYLSYRSAFYVDVICDKISRM